MKHLIELTESNFEREVLKTAGPVVVDFYAPWCGPCKMIAPLLEQFATEFDGKLKFAKLNVDDSPRLTGRYGITGVPTFMLFEDGRQIDRVVGVNSLQALKAWIERAAAGTPLILSASAV